MSSDGIRFHPDMTNKAISGSKRKRDTGIGKDVDFFFLKCEDFHAAGDCFPSVHPDFVEDLSFNIDIEDGFYESL